MERLLPDYGKFNLFGAPNHDDYNDVFSILVILGDRLILGCGPATTGLSRKIVDHYSFLVLALFHLQSRTWSRKILAQMLTSFFACLRTPAHTVLCEAAGSR